MALEGNTGISGALGYAAETTWGTSVAPSKWSEFLPGETLGLKQNYQRSGGIKAGRTFATGPRTVATTRTAGGGLSMEVGNQGFGAWLNMLHGETITGETLNKKTLTQTYTEIHKIGSTDPFKKSMTIVKAAPKSEGGVVDSYCYPGAIVNQATFDLAVNGFLTCAFDIDAKDETSEQTIGTVAYPAGIENFGFHQAVVKINTVEQKALGSLKMTFAKPTQGDRFQLGSTTRLQPVTNAFASIKLDVTADYTAKTLYDLFQKKETVPVEVTLTGNKMPTDVTLFSLKFVFPFCRPEGDTPNIADLGVLKQTIPMMVEDNTTEPPCTATYVTTDATI